MIVGIRLGFLGFMDLLILKKEMWLGKALKRRLDLLKGLGYVLEISMLSCIIMRKNVVSLRMKGKFNVLGL